METEDAMEVLPTMPLSMFPAVVGSAQRIATHTWDMWVTNGTVCYTDWIEFLWLSALYNICAGLALYIKVLFKSDMWFRIRKHKIWLWKQSSECSVCHRTHQVSQSFTGAHRKNTSFYCIFLRREKGTGLCYTTSIYITHMSLSNSNLWTYFFNNLKYSDLLYIKKCASGTKPWLMCKRLLDKPLLSLFHERVI